MSLIHLIIAAVAGVVGYLMFTAMLDRHIEKMNEVIRLIGG